MFSLLPPIIIYNIAKNCSIDDCKTLSIVNKKINRNINYWFKMEDFVTIIKLEKKNVKYYNKTNRKLVTYFYKDGSIKKEKWYQDELLHRDNDLPSIIKYFRNKSYIKIWCKNNKFHRDNDLPAVIHYEDDKIKSESWHQNDIYYRDNDLPSQIEYYENNNIQCELWNENGLLSRENKPARIDFYENGEKWIEYWYKDEKLHRDNNLPTIISYDKEGNIKSQEWYENGKHIRNNGCCRYCSSKELLYNRENEHIIVFVICNLCQKKWIL